MASACTTIMILSHIVTRPNRSIYEGLLPKNKPRSLEQRVSAVAGRCVCRPPPSPAPTPPPHPSDVCVSSLMKKFWYLGETLLSAEQTLPPLCPLYSHTAAPPNRNPISPLASTPSPLLKQLEELLEVSCTCPHTETHLRILGNKDRAMTNVIIGYWL